MNDLDSWLGQPSSFLPAKPVEAPVSTPDDGPPKVDQERYLRDVSPDLVEFMFQWLHVMLMGGQVADGKKRSINEAVIQLFKKHHMKPPNMPWLEQALIEDDQKRA